MGKLKLRYIIFVLVFITTVCYLYLVRNENFEVVNNIPVPPPGESVDLKKQKIYESVKDLIDQCPELKTDGNSLVHLINSTSGFGSQFTMIAQNIYYLHSLNPSLTIVPLFVTSSDNFKYLEPGIDNSFFLYFRMVGNVPKQTYNHYYVNVGVLNELPFFNGDVIPPMESDVNRRYIMHFREHFEPILNPSVKEHMSQITRSNPLVGIHIRSLAQKSGHQPGYLSMSLDDRLKKVSDSLGKDISLFVMTDVDDYIVKAKQIFQCPVYYIDNIDRIPTGDKDSVPLLNSGYKLGADIMNECYAMSLCDKLYVSNSNIPFLINMIRPDIEMIGY